MAGAFTFGAQGSEVTNFFIPGYFSSADQETHWTRTFSSESGGILFKYKNDREPTTEQCLAQLEALSIKENSRVFCHSLGCLLLLQYLRKHPEKTIDHLILVALPTPRGLEVERGFPVEITNELKALTSFWEGLLKPGTKEIDYDILTGMLSTQVNKITLVYSDNDTFLTTTEAEELKTSLESKDKEIEAICIAGGGHLGDSYTGYVNEDDSFGKLLRKLTGTTPSTSSHPEPGR